MRNIDNELPEGYEIRFANVDDIMGIMNFIKKHWKAEHILANDRDFFEYEFCAEDGKVNFVLLLKEHIEIVGILGFIPYSDQRRDMFTVMWKMLDNDEIMFGGITLLEYLEKNGDCRHIYSSGINEGTRNIYRYLRMKTDSLHHFYRLNPCMTQNVATIIEEVDISNGISHNENIRLRKINDWRVFAKNYISDNCIGHISKSTSYIVHRYFKHPKYQYCIYEVLDRDIQCNSYIIIRIQEYKGSKILRIIDYLGDIHFIEDLYDEIGKIMDEFQCEYADFYAYGINEKILNSAGFVENTLTSSNIIPNYFSPYVCQNIGIGIVYEKGTEPIIFKGDGDQDRPS